MADNTEEKPQEETHYRFLHRKWPDKATKGLVYLFPIELIGLVPCLVIFGLSQPDLYRTQMWKIGYENKLNSNPNVILYAYANYEPLPKLPLIWSSVLTELNVAISVMSLFFLLTKLIMYIMNIWFPIVSLFVNIAMVALYAVSAYGQIGPDYTDSRYPAPAAWYFRYGCSLAKQYNAYTNCQLAQSSLGLTLYMMMVYLVSLGFSIWAMIPHPRNDEPDEDEDEFPEPKTSKTWEMQSMKSPTTPYASMPFTPRTQAFYTLDRTLPLRQNAAASQQQAEEQLQPYPEKQGESSTRFA